VDVIQENASKKIINQIDTIPKFTDEPKLILDFKGFSAF